MPPNDIERLAHGAFTRVASTQLPREVRAVVATWNERRIRYVCYVDGAITEDLRTRVGHLASLMAEELFPHRRVLMDLERVDAPAPVPPPPGHHVRVYPALHSPAA